MSSGPGSGVSDRPTKRVTCYHCRGQVTISAYAISATCSHCYKGLVLDDLVVRDVHWAGKLRTCGKVVVERKGRVIGRLVQAAQGVEVEGTIEATVVSGGTVVVKTAARLTGDCRAPRIVIEPGATIAGGHFHIGPDAPLIVDEAVVKPSGS